MGRFHAFINAYKKDNSRYVYWQDDGRRVTLIAGQDGVTEEWIERIKAWHRQERRSMRRGEGKLVSLDALCARGDAALRDERGDPEARLIDSLDRDQARRRLAGALRSLTPKQRRLVLLIKVKGVCAESVAARMGVSEAAVRKQLQKAILSMRKQLM